MVDTQSLPSPKTASLMHLSLLDIDHEVAMPVGETTSGQ